MFPYSMSACKLNVYKKIRQNIFAIRQNVCVST